MKSQKPRFQKGAELFILATLALALSNFALLLTFVKEHATFD